MVNDDFMIRLTSLTDKVLFHPCHKGEGYVKLDLDGHDWKEFKDEEGFFSPNILSRHFKKLVNESLSHAEVPDSESSEPVENCKMVPGDLCF